jgi:hypothetical protein
MKEKVEGFARHLLTFVGGILVAKGIIDEGILAELTGALVSIVGVVWSIYSKK